MKKIFLVLASALFTHFCFSQDQKPHETARQFMRQNDFDNAILILTRELQADNKNIELQKDLALSLYLNRDYAKAMDIVNMMLESDQADVAAFQISGNVYKALEEVKEADKMYRKALKKFPKSGPLYSEYGELLWAKKDVSAIEYWEKGIKEDPSYAGNYYNAAVYYYYTKDKTWSLIYGEIFVNMESLTERANLMKSLLLTGYKEKLFADRDLLKDASKNAFSRAFLETMNKQSSLADHGVTTEVLTMIRTRFILDWFKSHGSKFPNRLFDFQQQLLKEGMFDAYNQWLFGSVENLTAYENWIRTHTEPHTKFVAFQRNRIFKIPPGQYYGDN